MFWLLRIAAAVWWAVFFGYAAFFVVWVLTDYFLGLEIGSEPERVKMLAGGVGLLFGVVSFFSAGTHLGPRLTDALLFPIRHALGWVIAILINVGIAWLLWTIFPHSTLSLVVCGIAFFVIAIATTTVSVEMPYQKSWSLAAIVRAGATARRVLWPFSQAARNFWDEKLQDARTGTGHRYGPRLLSRRHAGAKVPALSRNPGDPGLSWGGVPLPRRLASTGFLAAGMTGSGKTSHLLYLLRDVLTKLGEGGENRAVIYDYKAEAMVHLRARFSIPEKRIHLLHIFDRRTDVWDIAADIQTESQAMALTRILFPLPPMNVEADFFSKAAAYVVDGVITSFNEKAPGNWTLRDLVLALSDPAQIQQVLEVTPANLPQLRFIFPGDAAPMTSSVLATIAKDIRQYRVAAAQWHHAQETLHAKKYSIGQWLDANDIVVLGHSPANAEATQPIMRLLFELMARRVLDESEHTESEPDRTWFVLDELANLGRLEKLGELLRAGRSKGACVVLGFQDMHSLYEQYGKDLTHSLLNNIGNHAWLKLNDPETAQWASSLFSQREVQRYEENWDRHGVSGYKQHVFDQALVPQRKLLEPNEPGKLLGFFDSNEVGAWEWTLRLSEVKRDVAGPSDVEKRDYAWDRLEETKLVPWTTEDRRRLGLPLDAPGETKGTPTKPKPKGPPPYRRHRDRPS